MDLARCPDVPRQAAGTHGEGRSRLEPALERRDTHQQSAMNSFEILILNQSFAGSRAEALEADAARYWHLFYLRNQDSFFKDRHYLDREFPLLRDAASIVEIGCGVGNTLFPLAELNPAARVHGCDFAASAIDVVRRHPSYGGRTTAHVADITRERLQPEVAPGSMAVATLFFVLSALSPETMPQVGGAEDFVMSDNRVDSSACVCVISRGKFAPLIHGSVARRWKT